VNITEQEMSRATYELVSCAMVHGMGDPAYRETKDQKIIWESVADAVRQSQIPLAYLLQAVFDCTRTELRPGDGSKDAAHLTKSHQQPSLGHGDANPQ